MRPFPLQASGWTALAALLLLAAAVSPTGVVAEPDDDEEYFEDIDYLRITPPVPTDNGDKVEVLELFWYGCPHCFRFEPYLERWRKQGLPEYVELVQRPSVLNPSWAIHARAFFTAEVLGIKERIHKDFFEAIHVQGRPLNTAEQIAEFFEEHGVSSQAFHEAFNSFAVETELRKAIRRDRAYRVTGVPFMAVNGTYVTGGRMAGSNERMLRIIKFLAEKAHEERTRAASAGGSDGAQ